MGKSNIKLINNIVSRDTGEVVAYDFELRGVVKRVKKEDAMKAAQDPAFFDAEIVDDGLISTFDNLVGTVVIDNIAELDPNRYGKFATGGALSSLVQSSRAYRARDAFYTLYDWNTELSHTGQIGVLFGLRNTGKTTILHQLADRYIQEGVKVAYATYNYRECEINRVLRSVRNLVTDGYKVILIDEITYTTGMLNRVMTLSDEITAKVIIAGTDSLLLHWAFGDALFHRAVIASTTNMRYSEYMRLFPDSGITEFISNGGVLWKSEPQTVEQYISTSVVENIKHSIDMLNDSQRFTERDFFEDMDSNALLSLLVAVCECAAYEAVVKNVRKNWGKAVAWNLSLAHENVGGDLSELRKIMDGLRDYYVRLPVGEFDPKTAEVAVKRLRSLNFLTAVQEMREVGVWRDTLVITQPFVKQDFVRRTLSVINESGAFGMEATADKLASIAMGVILEDIVYFEAIERYVGPRGEYFVEDCVFKYRVGGNEIGVVVYTHNRETQNAEMLLIEVKLSAEKVKTSSHAHGQDRHLLNADFVGELLRYYSPARVAKAVLYRGATDPYPDENGIRWVNVEEWLLSQVYL